MINFRLSGSDWKDERTFKRWVELAGKARNHYVRFTDKADIEDHEADRQKLPFILSNIGYLGHQNWG